jgi:hypothetical protein
MNEGVKIMNKINRHDLKDKTFDDMMNSGYIRMPNELFYIFTNNDLTHSESKLIHVIYSFTIGYTNFFRKIGKIERGEWNYINDISISSLSNYTNIDTKTIKRELIKLSKRNVIGFKKLSGKGRFQIVFNVCYCEWLDKHGHLLKIDNSLKYLNPKNDKDDKPIIKLDKKDDDTPIHKDVVDEPDRVIDDTEDKTIKELLEKCMNEPTPPRDEEAFKKKKQKEYQEYMKRVNEKYKQEMEDKGIKIDDYDEEQKREDDKLLSQLDSL